MSEMLMCPFPRSSSDISWTAMSSMLAEFFAKICYHEFQLLQLLLQSKF